MQVMLMRLMSKGEYVIAPKGTKFTGSGKLGLKVMHDYMHWHCSIDYCVELSLVDETLCKKLLSFHKELISA